MDTFILVDLCDMMIIDIEIFPMRNSGHRLTNKVIQRFKAFFIHPVAETFTEIINYTEAIFHNSGTHLHIAGAKQHKLYRIFPCTNAADTGDGNAQFDLGVMYFDGEGVPVNNAEAYFWISLSILNDPRENRQSLLAEVAARLSGVKSWQVLMVLYVAAAVLAGLAGFLYSGLSNVASVTLVNSAMLPSVAAAVIGGTSIFGGRGGYGGTIVGALILTVIVSILSSLGYPEAVRQILFGALIVFVAAAYTRVTGES